MLRYRLNTPTIEAISCAKLLSTSVSLTPLSPWSADIESALTASQIGAVSFFDEAVKKNPPAGEAGGRAVVVCGQSAGIETCHAPAGAQIAPRKEPSAT
ncbi:hypothetical protein [Rhizobium gallicum]|uniref:hypothetical protein n=1 Tax=Rhizobium gallicum TaxID=56730 RepID=UPI0012EC1A25|nr:hypothetical protein [Rhizobium gallicum]